MSLAHEITELVLDRSLLHVFVAGPGQGEGIAVALPGEGWVLVDGCKVDGDELPLEAILSRHRTQDEPVVAMILTHPHRDHAQGFAELVERLRPRHVIVPACRPDHLGKQSLAWWRTEAAAKEWQAFEPAVVVRKALRAVVRAEETRPGAFIAGHDGVQVPTGKVSMFIRAPDPSLLTGLLEGPHAPANLVRRANEMSLVIELVFGETHIVLGGDLPTVVADGSPVRTGWDHVLGIHTHLGSHQGLKLPHHGSREAFHDSLLTESPGVGTRRWWVTPYNASGLPRSDPDDALESLLQREPTVLLTALSARREHAAGHPPPGRATLTDLRRKTEVAKGGWFVDEGLDMRRLVPLGPLEPVWACAFDATGSVRGSWRGAAALEVVGEPVDPAPPAPEPA